MSEQTTNLQTSVSHISLMQRPFGAPRIHMDENASGGSDAPVTATALPADAPESFDSPEGAARYFLNLKKQPAADGAEQATAVDELSDEDNAAPLDEVHGEDENADPDAEKLPLIARPKSWTEAEEAEWQSTPRPLQEKIAARELERDTALRRSQNDTAEKLKGITAKEQEVEKARQYHETQAKAAYEYTLREQTRDFPNIKTQADVEFLATEALRLAASDPVLAGQYSAYLQAWNTHQQTLAMRKAELDDLGRKSTADKQAEQKTRNERELALLIEKAPEFADAKKFGAAQQAAAKLFSDVGYSASELDALGNEPIIGDHRFQLIVSKALKFEALQAAKTAVAAKPVPPVQRPGTSRPASGNAERIQALTQTLTNTGSTEAATQLLIARRAANQRRAS